MSLPVGGKADKIGNKYEICCVILELLKLVDKKNGVEYVTYEPFGDEESGTDFIVGNNNGSTVYVQCKVSYKNNTRWTYAPLELAISKWKNIMNEKKIVLGLFRHWKNQNSKV